MRRSYTILEKSLWLLLVSALVIFGRYQVLGLQPDAALYAGLAAKILRSGEFWALSGSEQKFAQFFEHPPYFFQWGSWVLRTLGDGDGAARAMGGIPAFFGMLLILSWTWWRLGWQLAAIATFIFATFVHYTKFASTAMLEGPLSLGLALTAVAAFEMHWKPKIGLARPLLWSMLVAGLMISTAAKGIVGLGAWGGFFISLLLAMLFSPRSSAKLFVSALFIGLGLVVSLLPFAYWIYNMFRHSALAWIEGYFVQQVFRSATTNRGEVGHLLSGDRLYYVKILLREGLPWVPFALIGFICIFAAPIFVKTQPFFARFRNEKIWGWAWNSFAFLIAFALPLSFVKYQLPHYIHPTYALLVPLVAFTTHALFFNGRSLKVLESPALRWGLLSLSAVLLFTFSRGLSSTPNRGQEFIAIADKINALHPHCSVVVAEDEMELYRMEAFALWYWKGRAWERVARHLPSKIAVPPLKVYWEPSKNILWSQSQQCKI